MKLIEFAKAHSLLFLGGFLALFMVIITVITLTSRGTAPQEQFQSTPAPADSTGNLRVNPETREFYSESYIKEQEEINRQQSVKLEQDAKVASMIASLPYQGQYNKISYIIETNQVIVSQDVDNLEAADLEFQRFLKDHQIDDISWIENLVIQSE